MSDIELDGMGIENGGIPAVPEPEPTPEPAPEPEPEPSPEPEPEPTPEQAEEHKKLTGSARARAKAERLAQEVEFWKAEALKGKKPEETHKPEPVQANAAPTQDQFETHAEWVEALTDWKLEQKLQEREAKEQTRKITQSWEQKKEAARKELADFDEVIADMETPAPVVMAVMAESEHTAKIAYYLGQHPDELRKINQMSPPAAALAVGEIVATLKAPKAPTPKPTSKAPAPIKPATPSASAAPSRVTGMEVGY